MNWRYKKNIFEIMIWIGFFCAILIFAKENKNHQPDQSVYFAPEIESDWICCTGEQEKKELLETESKTKPAFINKLLEH